MEKTLIITFEDTNSNTTDNNIAIANTTTNIDYFNDFGGTTQQDYTDYLEAKGLVAVTHDELVDGEYTIYVRPKHRPRN